MSSALRRGVQASDRSPVEWHNQQLFFNQTEDVQTRIQCWFENGTLWLNQALIAELFHVSVPTVNEHLKGICDDGELDFGPTIRKFRIVRIEDKREVAREIEHYSLPVILAIGYRGRGTQFPTDYRSNQCSRRKLSRR